MSETESREVREAINATLKDILWHDGWGKSVWDLLPEILRADFNIDTDLLGLAQRAPNLAEMFQLGALIDNGIIGEKARKQLTEIIWKLGRIALSAEEGSEKAKDQLTAIHKLAYPDNYELPATVIRTLAESYHTSPHLARGWSIRSLMLALSFVVEPTRIDRSVLDGPVKLATWDLDRPGSELHKKATRHIKRGTTLQSLAISIYIEDLAKEGIAIEPRQLKLDLQKLKEWETVHLKDPSHKLTLWNPAQYPAASIPPIPIYSEGWKHLWRRGDKDRK